MWVCRCVLTAPVCMCIVPQVFGPACRKGCRPAWCPPARASAPSLCCWTAEDSPGTNNRCSAAHNECFTTTTLVANPYRCCQTVRKSNILFCGPMSDCGGLSRCFYSQVAVWDKWCPEAVGACPGQGCGGWFLSWCMLGCHSTLWRGHFCCWGVVRRPGGQPYNVTLFFKYYALWWHVAHSRAGQDAGTSWWLCG